MSTNYVSSDQQGNFLSNSSLGLLVTLAIFSVLPLMHLITNFTDMSRQLQTADIGETPPPPPDEDIPPPPEKDKELDKPEIEEPESLMTLAQLEIALTPGDGNAQGDFGFGDYDSGISALEGMEIFELQDLDKKPRPLFEVNPIYPYNFRSAKIKGFAIIEWIIDHEGRVLSVRCTKSSHREFEEPAMEAVRRSKFTPGRRNGENVAVRVRRTYEFSP